ncbi:MAG: hypothetical protein ACOVKV_00860, partial [Novosphingobium sp.]
EAGAVDQLSILLRQRKIATKAGHECRLRFDQNHSGTVTGMKTSIEGIKSGIGPDINKNCAGSGHHGTEITKFRLIHPIGAKQRLAFRDIPRRMETCSNSPERHIEGTGLQGFDRPTDPAAEGSPAQRT